MFVSSRITFSCNKSRISQTLLLPQPNFVQFSKFLFMLKVYKVCQNQLAQLHPVHTSLCHPSWLDMNKKLDTSRVFKDWHNFCSFNSRLRQKKMRICNQFWPRFSLEVCWILRQVQGQYFQGQGMEFSIYDSKNTVNVPILTAVIILFRSQFWIGEVTIKVKF